MKLKLNPKAASFVPQHGLSNQKPLTDVSSKENIQQVKKEEEKPPGGCYCCKRTLEDIQLEDHDDLVPELDETRCDGCGRGACRSCCIFGDNTKSSSVMFARTCKICRAGPYCGACRRDYSMYFCNDCDTHYCHQCKPINPKCCAAGCNDNMVGCKECLSWAMLKCSYCENIYHDSGCSDEHLYRCDFCSVTADCCKDCRVDKDISFFSCEECRSNSCLQCCSESNCVCQDCENRPLLLLPS